MPEIVAGDLARLRQSKQWSELFMAVHVPNTMFTGRVNSLDIIKGERFIPFDNGLVSPGYISSVVLEDTFVDPNGTSLDAHTPDIDVVGGGWIELQGDCDIQGNQANTVAVDGSNRVLAYLDTGISDAILEGDVTCKNNVAHYPGLMFRLIDANNLWHFRFHVSNQRLEVYRVTAAAWDLLWNTPNDSYPDNATYTMKVVYNGGRIDFFVDNVWVWGVNDTSHQTGTIIGIRDGAAGGAAVGVRFDNVRVGESGFGHHTTLWVGTNPGERDVGIIRVRDIVGIYPYTSGTIKVAENSDIHWTDNLHLTIKDEHRIWPRFPRVKVDEDVDPAVITWWKDYDIGYTDQTYNEPPVPIMGPPECAFIDDVTGLANVYFRAEDSYSPRNTLLESMIWTFPQGTYTNELLTPSFEVDGNADGLADDWNLVGAPVATIETAILLHGCKSQKVVTDAVNLQGVFSDNVSDPSTSAVAYVWVHRLAPGDEIVVELYDQTAGIVRGQALYSTPGWETAQDALGNTWYRIVVSSAALVPNNDHYLSVERPVGFATQVTTFYVDKALLKFGTLTPPDYDEVTWDTPGVYMVRLSITDEDGNTSYGYRPVFILDRTGENAPYQDFEIRNMRGNFNTGGWTATIRVFGECNVEDFPEGTQVVIFAKDWYAGEEVSIGGYPYRENIVFVGWIIADSILKDPLTGEVTFQIHSVDGELRNSPAFSISVERVTDTPDNWQEIQDMTLDLTGFYIGYWHSTLYEVSDVLESGDTRKVKYMDIPQSNVYTQLDRGNLAETIFARALSDRQSRVKYDVNPQYLTATKRDALDTIMTITDGDWLGRIDVDEHQEQQVSWVDVSGVRVAPWEKSYGVYSIAPGDVPAADGSFKQLGRLVVEDQMDMNRQAAFSFADQNKMYPGRTTMLIRVRVPLQGNYRIFDLHPQEWVEFPSLDTLREGRGPGIEDGTPWPSTTRFIPRNIDISFQNQLGNLMTTVDFEPECSGTHSSSVTFPGQPGTGGSVAILQQLTGNPDGTGKDIEKPYISFDIFADSPTWAVRDNGLPTFGGGEDFLANEFVILPPYTGKDGIDIRALIGADTEDKTWQGVYYNSNLREDTAWVAVLTDAMVLAQAYGGAGVINDWGVKNILVDSTTPGWALALVWVDHSIQVDKVHAFQTINYGITWTHLADISAQLGGGTNDVMWPESACIVDPYDTNYIYLKIKRGADWYWARSIDKGVTWATRMGGIGNNTIELWPGQGSDDAYYDPAGSGWSLTFPWNQMGDIGGNKYSFGIRYPNAGFVEGTEINTAICKIKAFPTGQLAGAITIRIRGVKELFLPTFTSRGAWDAWARTGAFVDWNPGNWVPGTTYNTPDLEPIIQELVDQADWTPGCAIALDFELTASAANRMRVAYSYENSPSETPILEINYDYAAVDINPLRPIAIFPHHNRDAVASYFGLAGPISYKTLDGWATRYAWFDEAGDAAVANVVPFDAHYPIVFLTNIQGTTPAYTSYLHTSTDGVEFGSGILLPVAIAQSFNVWPWAISGEALMYLGNRTGDYGGASVDYAPLQFLISELSGVVGSWVDKTGNLNDLIDALGRGRDRMRMILLLET